MKFRVKPEDLQQTLCDADSDCEDYSDVASRVAAHVNRMIEEFEGKLPKVYGILQDARGYGIGFSRTKGPGDKQAALLYGVEEIGEGEK